MKNIIELKVHNWSKLSKIRRKLAAQWLSQLAKDLERIGDNVSDTFTGQYP